MFIRTQSGEIFNSTAFAQISVSGNASTGYRLTGYFEPQVEWKPADQIRSVVIMFSRDKKKLDGMLNLIIDLDCAEQEQIWC